MHSLHSYWRSHGSSTPPPTPGVCAVEGLERQGSCAGWVSILPAELYHGSSEAQFQFSCSSSQSPTLGQGYYRDLQLPGSLHRGQSIWLNWAKVNSAKTWGSDFSICKYSRRSLCQERSAEDQKGTDSKVRLWRNVRLWEALPCRYTSTVPFQRARENSARNMFEPSSSTSVYSCMNRSQWMQWLKISKVEKKISVDFKTKQEEFNSMGSFQKILLGRYYL